MATDIYNYEKTFTKNKTGDKIKAENSINIIPALNDEQRRNISSAYNAKRSGIISEKQYADSLKKNGVSTGYLNSSSELSLRNSYADITKNKNENSFLSESIKSKQPKIPSEKLEQDRLRNLTGEYNLDKLDPYKLENSIKLKNKTPDDYYRERFDDLQKEKERIEEAFGPKTDFSISNFENNYDKMNKEEQEMMVHKMQLEFNRQGYRDKDGFSLKTDGKLGNKTKGVYERYIKDNPNDYKEAVERKNTPLMASSSLPNKSSTFSTKKTSNIEFNNLYAQNSKASSISDPDKREINIFPESNVSVATWGKEKSITTELMDNTMYKNKKGVNYTMYAIIQRLIEAKNKYMVAQKKGDIKQMNIQKEIGSYIKAMIKMSNEFSNNSGDKKFTQKVLDAENYDLNGTNPYEAIKKWENIQNYSIGLSNNPIGKADQNNNKRGITIERIDNDIAKIYDAFRYSDNPVIYISETSYSVNPDDIDINDIKDKKTEKDYFTKTTYYYTNDNKAKEKYRAGLLPADINSDIGESKNSGAEDFFN